MKIGLIASPSDRIVVERNGEQISLKQGDAILAGDLIQNQDIIPVDIELPAQTTGQADSLITLAPEAAARVGTITGSDGVSTLLEVTSVTQGVELYALGDGQDGAVLVADASGGSFSGLIGSGVLTDGGMGALGSGAAVVGGAAGLAAIASTGDSGGSGITTSPAAANESASTNSSTGTGTTNSSNTTSTTESPQASHNMDSSTPVADSDTSTSNPSDTATPNTDSSQDSAGLDLTNPESVAGFVQDLPNQDPQDAPTILADTLTDVLTSLTDALGISSGSMPSDNPLAPITDNIPTGMM